MGHFVEMWLQGNCYEGVGVTDGKSRKNIWGWFNLWDPQVGKSFPVL